MDPTTGGALISGLKALHDLVKQNKDPKMMQKLLEIQSQIFELVNENQHLKSDNARLKEDLAKNAEIEIRKDGAVWRKTDTASPDFGGFCPNCHGEDRRLIKLTTDPNAEPGSRRWCSVCKLDLNGRWW